MIYLTIKTDKPEAEISLYRDNASMAEHKWQAHKQLAESIHTEIDKLMKSKGLDIDSLDGLIVYKGPGSFTGLRIGLSVANTFAYGLNMPIVGANGSEWIKEGISKLKAHTKERQVMPEYGAPVHVTTPKK